VYSRSSQHLHTNYILVTEWYGFRKGISSENAAFTLTDSVIKSINQKICVEEIFCDMAKTFDCMNREILLVKLHFSGTGGVGLPENWFCLSNRRQNVEVKSPNTTKNVSCVWRTLKHGANKVHFCMHEGFQHFTTFTDNP
jgi:hypothetical protein